MAASKKSSALQVTRSKLQEVKNKLVSQRKETQEKINSLKHEFKAKVSEAMMLGFEKGHSAASKESEKYALEKEKAVNSAVVKFNKQFKSKVAKPIKVVTNKAAPKKAVAKKVAIKKLSPKKTAGKKK
jgi:hypothetical protein